jgi:hypothetical protein
MRGHAPHYIHGFVAAKWHGDITPPLLLYLQGYGVLLAPGQEVSLEYKFFPDPRLEPRDFSVALSVLYRTLAKPSSAGKDDDLDGVSWHSHTFFNQTVQIVEVKKLIDWELLGLLGIFGAGATAICKSVVCAHGMVGGREVALTYCLFAAF